MVNRSNLELEYVYLFLFFAFFAFFCLRLTYVYYSLLSLHCGFLTELFCVFYLYIIFFWCYRNLEVEMTDRINLEMVVTIATIVIIVMLVIAARHVITVTTATVVIAVITADLVILAIHETTVAWILAIILLVVSASASSFHLRTHIPAPFVVVGLPVVV